MQYDCCSIFRMKPKSPNRPFPIGKWAVLSLKINIPL